MNTQHTPGPWYVGHISGDVLRDINDKAYAIAHVADWSEETAANARLIAAAPELLEALQGLLVDVTYHEHPPGNWSIKWAYAAIAKATGADK